MTHHTPADKEDARRNECERQLHINEEWFRAVFDEGPLGMAITELNTQKFILVNQRLCDMLGYRKDELVGEKFSDIAHPDDVKKDDAAALKMYRGETPRYHAEKRYAKKNGEYIWIHTKRTGREKGTGTFGGAA